MELTSPLTAGHRRLACGSPTLWFCDVCTGVHVLALKPSTLLLSNPPLKSAAAERRDATTSLSDAR